MSPRIQDLSYYPNDANANYNTLLTQINHRFPGSFEFDAQNTYSETINQESESDESALNSRLLLKQKLCKMLFRPSAFIEERRLALDSHD